MEDGAVPNKTTFINPPQVNYELIAAPVKVLLIEVTAHTAVVRPVSVA
jgi:hypothetical protein